MSDFSYRAPSFTPLSLPMSANPRFSIVQLSDLHLTLAEDSNTANFDRVIADLADCDRQIDLVVVTGDLVQTIDDRLYEQIFAKLDKLGLPYVCIAGNHDVTQELDCHLPFEQRRHVAMLPHPRLVDRHVVTTPHWQLLFCNSAVAGQIAGAFSPEALRWLAKQLTATDKPSILFCHHHVLPLDSAWLDGHIAKNYPELWQVIAQTSPASPLSQPSLSTPSLSASPQSSPLFSKLVAIFTGHVHQEQSLCYQGVTVYTVPSLSVQFLPRSDAFAIESDAQIGYRWITLYNNGQLATGVKKINTSSPF